MLGGVDEAAGRFFVPAWPLSSEEFFTPLIDDIFEVFGDDAVFVLVYRIGGVFSLIRRRYSPANNPDMCQRPTAPPMTVHRPEWPR